MERLPISVIVVARNAERTIDDCLDSIQRDNPAEIIVIDGNSTDRTVEIAKRYTDRIYSDEGKGLSFARQLGAERATQEYIAYVDSDVTLTEGALATMLAEFQSSSYISIHAQMSPDTKWSNYWEWAQDQHAQVSQSHLQDYIGMLTCLFRRETILGYRFDFSLDLSERGMDDLDLELRLMRDGYKFGTSSAVCSHHHRVNLKSLARHQFLVAALAPRYIRKYGLWHARFWSPLATIYWLGYCLIKGKLRLIPYFLVNGIIQTAGMVKGFFEIIGEWIKTKRGSSK